MPEQEYLPPPRRPGPAPDYPMGSWQTAGPPPPQWTGPGPQTPEDSPSAPDDWTPGDGSFGDWAPRDLPPGGRAAGARALRGAARRRRRWLVMAAGLVVVAGGVTAALVLPGRPAPAPVTPDGLITTFQPGEFKTVPTACGTVPAATVQHYLPGQAKQASPLPIDGSAGSACDWTIDQAPVYRLLELSLLAYAPSGLASGNGSATHAATDAYAQTEQALADPSKRSAQPKAAVAALPGLGNEAFSATQVFRRGGAVTDVATVVVRYHNVLVSVTLNGLQHANRGNYGPVSMSSLSAAALAFAQAAEATLH